MPVVTLSRAKFGTFKEYHTHLDNLSFIKEKTLKESYNFLKDLIKFYENKIFFKIKRLDEKKLFPKTKIKCEPFLTKYKLMSGITSENNYEDIQKILNILSYCDGVKDIFEISNQTKTEIDDVIKILKLLKKKKIIYFK